MFGRLFDVGSRDPNTLLPVPPVARLRFEQLGGGGREAMLTYHTNLPCIGAMFRKSTYVLAILFM